MKQERRESENETTRAMDRLQADYAKRMAIPKPPKIDWAKHGDCH